MKHTDYTLQNCTIALTDFKDVNLNVKRYFLNKL